MTDVPKDTKSPGESSELKPKTDIPKSIQKSVRGESEAGENKQKYIEVQTDNEKINQLLEKDPENTSRDEGRQFHKKIQSDLIGKNEYENAEVGAKNKDGEIIKRVREVTRGKNKGHIVEEGTIYDLYSETDKTISTGEIKPFSPSGIIAAQEKIEKQVDIEENFGGRHDGKTLIREIIFYDPRDGSLVMRGPANSTIEKARNLAQAWST